MRSEFEIVPEYPQTFALWVGTNSGVINTLTQESETSWDFYDENGGIVFTSGSLISNTQYRDTLSFMPGCYTFVMEDSDEDGLDFWANNDGGGMVRFREIGASWLKSFNADFGTNIIHQFTIEESQSTNEALQNEWKVFPNPTKNNVMIEGFCNTKAKIIVLDNLGRAIIKPIETTGFISETIDLAKFDDGVYFIKIDTDQGRKITKVIKQ